MKKRRIIAAAAAFLVLTAGLLHAVTRLAIVPAFGHNAGGVEVNPVLIIDPGHGGADGGAVSASGTLESAINLDIALKLDGIMGLFGVETILTRESEELDYSSDATTIRAKKVEDQKKRVALINGTQNATLISIHQNMYSSQGPSGAQVLYANTPGSDALAAVMQRCMIDALNPQNRRTETKIQDSVYLMKNISCTAVLVECGFLSNPAEEALLNTEEYRLKVAVAVAAGYLAGDSLLGEEGETNEGENGVLLH